MRTYRTRYGSEAEAGTSCVAPHTTRSAQAQAGAEAPLEAARVCVPPPRKASLFAMAPDARARPPIALAYPANMSAAAPARLYVLPHPRSGAPTYFSVQDDATYELLLVRPDQRAGRSWMLAPGEGASMPGHILRDGALYVLSPMDPAFLLLGLLACTWGERRFCPRDDLAETAAEHYATQRAAELAARAPDAAPATTPSWPDITAVLALPAMQAPLRRLCATQTESSALDGLVYRLDEAKVYALFDQKIERVLRDAADVIEVQSQRQCGASATEAEIAAAQRRVAARLVAAYVPVPIEEAWRAQRQVT